MTRLTPLRCRIARDLLGWSAEDLAQASGVSIFTIRRFEEGREMAEPAGITPIRRAFEGAGIEFGPDHQGNHGVRLAIKRR